MSHALRRALLLIGLVHCAGPNEGVGTRDLHIVAEALYIEDGTNVMTFTVRVEKAGLPVNNATITFTDHATGDVVTLTEDAPNQRYTGTMGGYRRRVHLRVVADESSADGSIEGPTQHSITFPAEGAALTFTELGDLLSVKWRVSGGQRSHLAMVRVGNSDVPSTFIPAIGDSGRARLNTAGLTRGTWTIRVRRENRSPILGGAGRSWLAMGYETFRDVDID